MWKSIEESIASVVGQSFTIKSKEPLSGGDIHKAFKISNGKDAYFVKLNDASKLDMFLTESRALSEIKHTQTIKTPEFITASTSLNFSYIVLEYLDLQDITEAKNWATFGEQLAGLHLSDNQAMFGWDEENFIGTTLQPNKWMSNWSSFFAEQRIGFQLKLLEDKGYTLIETNEFLDVIKRQLKSHTPNPSLLHGDLWRGNLSFTNHDPVIYDPASYFGDGETDLAMTELFGCLPAEFYHAYYSITPQSEDYVERKEMYNLYHILNHCNLFGGQYINNAQSLIKRIMSF